MYRGQTLPLPALAKRKREKARGEQMQNGPEQAASQQTGVFQEQTVEEAYKRVILSTAQTKT